ncbi:Srb7p [Rhodotorula paludigena]|uniref:Srb7p n=1 Tax=Rhodotorula paludigena TaxID=86838 RepID=UPI003181A8CF
MEVARELSHMDRLTQTQNSIDELIRIMYSTLGYLSRKASFKQLNPNFPVTQSIPDIDPPDVFEANQKELVTDFLRKAKQLEYLIDALPSSAPPPPPSATTSAGPSAAGMAEEEHDEAEFLALENEMQAVNDEYLEALGQAEALHSQLQASLHGILESRSGAAPAPSAAAAAADAAA